MEIVALLAGVKRDARFGARHGHLLFVGPAMIPKECYHSPADSPESWTLLGSPAQVGSAVTGMEFTQTYLQMTQCSRRSTEALAIDL